MSLWILIHHNWVKAIRIIEERSEKYGSHVKNTGFFFRGPGLISQNLYGGKEYSITPVPGGLMSFYGLLLQYLHANGTQPYTKMKHQYTQNIINCFNSRKGSQNTWLKACLFIEKIHNINQHPSPSLYFKLNRWQGSFAFFSFFSFYFLLLKQRQRKLTIPMIRISVTHLKS